MLDLNKMPDLELYLIRHADPEKIRGTWTAPDANLSDVGINQAEILADKLCRIEFDRIISSSLPRAKQTAEMIIRKQNKPVTLESYSWLNEIDLGDFAGKSDKDLRQEYPHYFSVLQRDPDKSLVANLILQHPGFRFPNGESLDDIWSRISLNFISLIRNTTSHTKVALIAHGGSLTIISLLLLGAECLSDITKLFTFRFDKSNYLRLKIKSGTLVILELNPISY